MGRYQLALSADTPFGDQEATVELSVAEATGLDGGVVAAAGGILAILRSAGASPADQIQAIQRVPWASSHYPTLGVTYRELQG